MPSVTRNKWIARFSLVAYVLLVCFGHALHALPGHQHDGHHHGGHSGEPACCHQQVNHCETESRIGPTHTDHDHGSKYCVFQRYAEERKFEQNESSKSQCCQAESQCCQAGLELKSQDSHDLCSICELLSSPQAAAIHLDRDSGVEFVQSAILETYCFYQLQSLSAFSARGPPAAHPLA